MIVNIPLINKLISEYHFKEHCALCKVSIKNYVTSKKYTHRERKIISWKGIQRKYSENSYFITMLITNYIWTTDGYIFCFKIFSKLSVGM